MKSSNDQSIKNAKVISIISTKGGVGKTTTAANLGAIISDINKKVLLIDLDNQPTLSSYFNLTLEKDQGTYELIGLNNKNIYDIVSQTTLPNLDIVVSNDHQNQLNRLLSDAPGGAFRLFNLLPALRPYYDLILIDTQGARSATLEMSIVASDLAISPVPPEMLAAREFSRGTIRLIQELIDAYSLLGVNIPIVQLFINRADFSSTDSKLIADGLRQSFSDNTLLKVLSTIVPAIATYRKAATMQQPAHRFEPKKPHSRTAPAALETLRSLACEIFPEWQKELNGLTAEKLQTQIEQEK